MTHCSSCRCPKPADQFKLGDKVYKSCTTCRNYQRLKTQRRKETPS